MKKNLTLFSFLLFFIVSNAQIDNIKIGYQEFPTTVTGHAADDAGNMYYSGQFKGELKVNDQVLKTGAGAEDIFFVKTDATGKTIYSKSFGSKSPDYAIRDGLSFFDNNLYLGTQITDAVTFQSFSVQPYSNTIENMQTGCIVKLDTSGNVKWVNKTSLVIRKVYTANNIIHAIGPIFTGTVMVNDKVLNDSLLSGSIVHLMFDTAGNLLNYKTITLRNTAISFDYFPEYLASYRNGDLCLLLRISTDSSFKFGNKIIPLPTTQSSYYVLIKTDTSYSKVFYKVLNPLAQAFDNPNGPAFTMHLSKEDTVYMIFSTYNNSKDLEYDSLKIAVNRKNVLVVFDPSLKAKRAINLGNPDIGNDGRRALNFKTINTTGNTLLITGTYVGTNQLPVSNILNNDSTIFILPNLNTTIDLNGPTKNFIAKTTFDLTNSSLTWAESDYSSDGIPFYNFSHTVSDSLLIYTLWQDNVWKPKKFNVNTNVISGSVKRNVDGADDIRFVNYFTDGSRIIMGKARGRTALDTLPDSVNAYSYLTDDFIARVTSKGEVKWFKRFHSTFGDGNLLKCIIKDDKAYFLIYYNSPFNDSIYITLDKKVYSMGGNVNLLAAIDTSGNISVINLKNDILNKFTIRDFTFCQNSDIALLTEPSNLVAYSSFPANNGSYIFRLNPVTNVINSARKFIDDPYSEPFHIVNFDIDNNDNLYLSAYLNYSENPDDLRSFVSLHDGNKIVDSIKIENSGRLAIFKMNWNKFNWYKKSDGLKFEASLFTSSVFSINNKVILTGRPSFSNSNDTLKGSFYWDNQLIMSDMNSAKTYFFSMDSSGAIEKYKSISNFEMRSAKKKANGSIIITGSNLKATTIDTISVGFQGGTDAIGFIIDSTFKAIKTYRLATPYYESMSDMDIFQDSLVSFAYMAQTTPSLYANRPVVLASDYDANAYLGSTVIAKEVVLPIQLISFNAIRKDNIVDLDWTTLFNEEGGKYIVQRSHNGTAFKDIYIKNSANSSSAVIYRTTDNLNEYGKYYYRLKIVSKDEKISYSKIVTIIYPSKQNIFYFDNNSQQLYILRSDSQNYEWKLFDASGKMIMRGQKTVGNTSVSLSMQPRGQYIIRTIDENGVDQTYKFIK